MQLNKRNMLQLINIQLFKELLPNLSSRDHCIELDSDVTSSLTNGIIMDSKALNYIRKFHGYYKVLSECFVPMLETQMFRTARSLVCKFKF